MSHFPKRGEIYWANLDPTLGSEIAKTRPVVIVSNDINNEYAATITVLPITSSTDRIYPYEVEVTAKESGLKNTSKIKANQIRTIDKVRISRKLGELAKEKMQEIDKAIKIHLSIDK
jgi:mRNA interferase MazF